ncbi:MAG: GNAT family N-acetyltransferase [Actinomycetota bacterium]|nr:MAG: GNAT family N-acetyltransferase [Actinomycetota bacterium]
MDLTIRPYASEDWPRLCAIHDAARRDELSAAGLTDAFLTLEQTYENEALFAGEVAVAELGGEVVGFVAYTTDEVTWLYVDPRRSRRGAGRALLRHALTATRGAISTEVLVGNEAALALYLSEGFRVARAVDGRLVGNEAYPASGYVLEHDGGAA